MASRETQNRILDTAIALFNEEGTAQVSGNRIAQAAGVSKGNLHYHFKTKEEVVFSIWLRIEQEVENWQDDPATPTVLHMAEITHRQYSLIWRYRFFYRELTTLLDRDDELKYRFRRQRRRRMEDIQAFFEALVENGVAKPPQEEDTFPNLIRIAWMVSDYWLSFISADDRAIDAQSMQEGYQLVLRLFDPILTDKARAEIPDSLRVFSVDRESVTGPGRPDRQAPRS